MTSTELVLPTSVVPSTWDANTAALMEFAGLTWMEGQTRRFAPSGIMAAFIQACGRTGLDPTAKQIYAAQMGGKWTVLVGVDGMRLVAQRTGQYDGQDPIEWQAVEDGPWSQTPGSAAPYAARIAIYRKGVSRPIVQTVTFKEFGGRGGNWDKRPAHMLGIRAETHGFRRLFPMELSGLYTAEDIDGGTFTDDAIVVAPSEDWAALIEAAESKDELTEILTRAQAVNELSDAIRTQALTRLGMFSRSEVESAPEALAEQTPAEYDAASAAEFDAQATNG